MTDKDFEIKELLEDIYIALDTASEEDIYKIMSVLEYKYRKLYGNSLENMIYNIYQENISKIH